MTTVMIKDENDLKSPIVIHTSPPRHNHFVKERFVLDDKTKSLLHGMKAEFGYGCFGEFIFYRTYSRMKKDGLNESWADCVIRVTEGTFSIRKDWYTKCGIEWEEKYWQIYAEKFVLSLFEMHWTPPGRGFWAMGTDYVYERGSFSLYNCAYIQIRNLPEDAAWMMDALMNGVGVGFEATPYDVKMFYPNPDSVVKIVIGDDREGWCESIKILLESYTNLGHHTVEFDYNEIRKKGLPIRGFGGLSSGPDSLIKLHKNIRRYCSEYIQKRNSTRLIADVCNSIGCCVVAGNVRRSAEIAIGLINDETFLNLKDYDKYPERAEIGWMSNNSVRLEKTEDFEYLPEIAKRVVKRGEPGFMNQLNVRKYGRVGKDDNVRVDKGTGMNPCGEIPLESYEVCVSKNTRIQTKNGCPKIKNVVGQEVEIWNGKKWNKVIVKQTSKNSELNRIYFTDGSYLECTNYHKFYIRKHDTDVRRGYIIKRTNELRKRHTLLNYELGKIKGCNESDAYEYGYFMGDGCCGKNDKGVGITLYGKEINNVKIKGKRWKIGDKPNYNVLQQRINLTNILDYDKCKQLKNINRLPDWVFEMDSYSICQFMAGYLDADGTVAKKSNGVENYVIYGPLGRLRDLQILCRRIGINHATVNFVHDGETNYGKRNYPLYNIYIPSYECNIFEGQIKKVTKFGSDKLLNPRTKNTYISRKKCQRIIKIEKIKSGPTYCFEEKEEHKGVFNNVITGQCNLAETYPTRCDEEEWYKACEYATFYCSTVCLLPTSSKKTNQIVNKNRRIGVGIVDFSGWEFTNGLTKVTKWMREGYKRIRKANTYFADEAGIPESIRVTTVKPGGTVPKLAGRTSGVGHPTFIYTIRRVRVQQDSPIAAFLVKHNVPNEKDKYSDNTIVFEFPIEQGPARPATEVSIWEQAMNIVLMQREWSDNAVSNTLYFKPMWELVYDRFFGKDEKEDFKDIILPDLAKEYGLTKHSMFFRKKYLQSFKASNDDYKFEMECSNSGIHVKILKYNHNHEQSQIENVLAHIAPLVKSVSMLPHVSLGVYEQMPEEGCTKEEYEGRLKVIKPMNWKEFNGLDGMDTKFCDGEACEINFNNSNS